MPLPTSISANAPFRLDLAASQLRLRVMRIPDQKRQRFRFKPATISDSIPPRLPTEVRHHDGPLEGEHGSRLVRNQRTLPGDRPVDEGKRPLKREDRRPGLDPLLPFRNLRRSRSPMWTCTAMDAQTNRSSAQQRLSARNSMGPSCGERGARRVLSRVESASEVVVPSRGWRFGGRGSSCKRLPWSDVRTDEQRRSASVREVSDEVPSQSAIAVTTAFRITAPTTTAIGTLCVRSDSPRNTVGTCERSFYCAGFRERIQTRRVVQDAPRPLVTPKQPNLEPAASIRACSGRVLNSLNLRLLCIRHRSKQVRSIRPLPVHVCNLRPLGGDECRSTN